LNRKARKDEEKLNSKRSRKLAVWTGEKEKLKEKLNAENS